MVKHFYASFKGYADIAEFLLQQGASTTISNDDGKCPIHIASWKGQAKVIEKLIQYGANTNLCDKKCLPPLYYAARADQLQVTSLLLQKGASVNTRTKENLSYLYIACQHGNFKMVELLISNGASYLIEHGAHLSIKGEYISPLMSAVMNKHIEIVDILLDAGADPNFVDTSVNQSSLHVAASRNYPGIMTRLINNGADVNKTDKNGLTPLHLASVYGKIEAAKLLLYHGADVTKTSIKGNTPLKIAKSNEMKLLLGTDPSMPSAPPISEDVEISRENVEKLPVKELENQLEEKMQQLCIFQKQCNDVELEIDDLKKRIDEQKNSSEISPNMHDHFECPICLEIPYSPNKIFQCEQGHIFCEVCYKKGLTFCPECRIALTPDKLIRNRRLEDVIKGLSEVLC